MSDTRTGFRVIIGYAERIDLPDWGVDRLRAKADTGARSSALHVSDLKRIGRGGVRARFRVVLDRSGKQKSVQVEAPIVRVTEIRSSTGHTEERVVVRTSIRIGPVTKEIEVTLTERGEMRYRMLLGRTALAPELIVDSSHRYTCGLPRKASRKTSAQTRKTSAQTRKTTARRKPTR